MSAPSPAAAAESRIDVILPAYNGAKVIGRAIDSALSQAGVQLRVVVVDDGSRDDSEAIARSYGGRVEVISQANRGVSGARNTGLAACTSPYVALLDQDDVWKPGKLRRQLDLLQAHPAVGLVFTDMVRHTEDGTVLEDGYLPTTPAYASESREPLGDRAFLMPGSFAGAVMRYNFVSPSTVLARAEALRSIGGFDESLRLCDDAECWLRLLRDWRAIAIEEPLVRSLVWEGNASLRTQQMVRERIQIAEKTFARPELYAPGTVAYFQKERAVSFYRLGVAVLREGDAAGARRHFLTSLRASVRPTTLLALATTFVGRPGRAVLWRIKRAVGLRWSVEVE